MSDWAYVPLIILGSLVVGTAIASFFAHVMPRFARWTNRHPEHWLARALDWLFPVSK